LAEVPRDVLIVIYPYKFHKFVWDMLELELLAEYVDVVVWDISNITSRAFADAVVSKRMTSANVVVINSVLEFVIRLVALRKSLKRRKVCVLNEIPLNGPFEILCYFLLATFLVNQRVKILDLLNPGVLPDAIDQCEYSLRNVGKKSVIERLLSRFHASESPIRFTNELVRHLLQRLASPLSMIVTHRLVAGDYWVDMAHKGLRDNGKIVLGHSHDFSTYLMSRETNVGGGGGAVLLDSAGPMFVSDTVYSKSRVYFTVDKWYPALVAFFEHLESQLQLNVEIAGHYKSAHPPNPSCFAGRRVLYGQTVNLVKSADLVITIHSTAISYAVIYRKPVLFIYSNQLLQDSQLMASIKSKARSLGTMPININDFPLDLSRYLIVDEEKYSAYEKNVLSSEVRMRPNYRIIIEDIMGDS